MNLILVKNLKNKNIYRILEDAVYNNKENIHTKIIIYKEYTDFNNKNLFAMDVGLFWETHKIINLNDI